MIFCKVPAITRYKTNFELDASRTNFCAMVRGFWHAWVRGEKTFAMEMHMQQEAQVFKDGIQVYPPSQANPSEKQP